MKIFCSLYTISLFWILVVRLWQIHSLLDFLKKVNFIHYIDSAIATLLTYSGDAHEFYVQIIILFLFQYVCHWNEFEVLQECLLFLLIVINIFNFIFRTKSICANINVQNKSANIDNKVRRIGPHIEIFQVFQERKKHKITKKTVKMITVMQAYIRGWLERKRFQRVMTKVKHILKVFLCRFMR